MPESGVSTLLATSIATSPVRRFTVSLINVLFIVALFVAVTPTEVRAATNAGMLYMPVIWPGFSWDNLKQLAPGTSKIPRLGGELFWNQFYVAATNGLDMAYIGMFDEVDEATAIFKVSNTPPTQGYFVTYDGLPTDWYLRLAAEGTKVLTGERPNTPTIPISP